MKGSLVYRYLMMPLRNISDVTIIKLVLLCFI